MRSFAVLAIALLGLAVIANAQTVRVVGLYSDSTCLTSLADKDLVGSPFGGIANSPLNNAAFAAVNWIAPIDSTKCYLSNGATYPGTTGNSAGVTGTSTLPVWVFDSVSFGGNTAWSRGTIAALAANNFGTGAALASTLCPGTTADATYRTANGLSGRPKPEECSAYLFANFITDLFRFQPEAAGVDKTLQPFTYFTVKCDRNLQLVYTHYSDSKCTYVPSDTRIQVGTVPMGCYKLTDVTQRDATGALVTGGTTQAVYARIRCTTTTTGASFALTPATLAVAFFTILAIFVQRQL